MIDKSEKRYQTFEKVAMGTVYTVIGAFLAAVLLGVYALADLVF